MAKLATAIADPVRLELAAHPAVVPRVLGGAADSAELNLGALRAVRQRRGHCGERRERPQQRRVADGGGVDGGGERAGGAGRRWSSTPATLAIVPYARGAVEIGDRGRARERGHAVAHAEQHESGERPRPSRATLTTTAMPSGDQYEDARGRRGRGQARGERPRTAARPGICETPTSPTAKAAKAGVVAALEQERDREARSSRSRSACARKNAAESSQNGTSAAPPRRPTRLRPRRCSGAARRRRRSTSAWSGTVIAARIAARTTSASRQPWASISAWDSGRKMKLASAATSVIAVIARRRSSGDRKPLGEHGERRLVEHGGHHEPDRRPRARRTRAGRRPATRPARAAAPAIEPAVISARGLRRSR